MLDSRNDWISDTLLSLLPPDCEKTAENGWIILIIITSGLITSVITFQGGIFHYLQLLKIIIHYIKNVCTVCSSLADWKLIKYMNGPLLLFLSQCFIVLLLLKIHSRTEIAVSWFAAALCLSLSKNENSKFQQYLSPMDTNGHLAKNHRPLIYWEKDYLIVCFALLMGISDGRKWNSASYTTSRFFHE